MTSLSNQPQSSEPEPIPKKRRVRKGRKRSVFLKTPRPAWPVRGLWEQAPKEEKERAHKTCMLMLEYWLGKKSKAEIAKELEVSPLRVWQLSQQALSGMLAGLLTQPRKRVTPEAFERRAGESREALKKRIATLEKELSRTEDLVRVLRTAPWLSPSSDSPEKGGPTRAKTRKKKTSAARSPSSNRTHAARDQTTEGGSLGSG